MPSELPTQSTLPAPAVKAGQTWECRAGRHAGARLLVIERVDTSHEWRWWIVQSLTDRVQSYREMAEPEIARRYRLIPSGVICPACGLVAAAPEDRLLCQHPGIRRCGPDAHEARTPRQMVPYYGAREHGLRDRDWLDRVKPKVRLAGA